MALSTAVTLQQQFQPEGITQPALLVGTVGMFLGMLYFINAGRGETDPRKQEYYIITAFVPAIAFVSYLSMTLGFGATTVEFAWLGQQAQEHTILWARYADWLFTTPLLLLDLALLAGANRQTIGTLVGLDVAMIVTGLMAALTNRGALGLSTSGVRIIWWGVSCGFFLALLYLLLGTLSRNAARQPGEVGRLFSTLRNLTAVLWTLYPIVWIIGTEGLGLISLGPETAAYAVLDLLAKVGFGFILIRSRSVIDQATASAGAATADD
jgi:bacteriorhodopsin